MKAEELRIGNYFQWSQFASMGRGVDQITNGQQIMDYLDFKEGIHLTDDWLLKFGFEQKNGAWWVLDLPDNSEAGTKSRIQYSEGWVIWEQKMLQGFTKSQAAKIITELEQKEGPIQDDDKVGMVMQDNSVILEIPMTFVHQLQNWWYANTGKELVASI